jgi:heavy metal efflux system protein
MIAAWVDFIVRTRTPVLVLLGALLIGGVFAARTLPIDAVPDTSTIQVSVLTEAPGLSPEEVERMITFPIEAALNGVPRSKEIRSISRSSLSAVTVVFDDAMDVWFARQLVVERLRQVENELPAFASRPELAPVSTGLGEIYQFVVRSDSHSPMQLRTILDWEIVPKLRSVTGVIDINTMGGELKEFHVVADPSRLHAVGITLDELSEALKRANRSAGGGYLERGPESFSLRGVGMLRNEADIGNVVVRLDPDGTPILVGTVAQVRVGAALRNGVVTQDGKGEAVSGIVMMLLGSNSRTVVTAVAEKMKEVRAELPPGVSLVEVYDRSNFVGRTLSTVMMNLLEGVLIVTLVLAVFLGTVRGALVVALGIPTAMSIALFGMHIFGITGDLMSLGAIDFGFLVDGPIVVLEAVATACAGRALAKSEQMSAYSESTARVMKPVIYAVAIIMLVYLPLQTLQGVEGKMFKPMATTMACALFGALVFTAVFFPALIATFVPPTAFSEPRWIAKLTQWYAQILPKTLQHRGIVLGASAALLVAALLLFLTLGADFVPRIDEGDLVVTIRRAPSIALSNAKGLDLQTEQVLHQFPEVITSLGMTGRSEIAIDPVGNDNTDILVHLKPKKEWTTAHDLDDLSLQVKNAIESQVSGTFVSVSQPIEDKTNELISGSRADVQIQVFGPDLTTLRQVSEQIGATVRGIQGTGDVRIERLLGLPVLTVTPDRGKLAKHGVALDSVLQSLEAARLGIGVGYIFEQQRRFALRVLAPPRAATPDGLGDLFVSNAAHELIPVEAVATVSENEGPAQIRREQLSRTVRVEVNLRGRDLVSWVNDAQTRVAKEIHLPAGYEITWGGQFENFARAKARLGIVVPLSFAIIFIMLLAMFQSLRHSAAVATIVPLALLGGVFGLVVRGMPFSISAAVGFIALAGVSVLTGVVVADEVKRRMQEKKEDKNHAVHHGAVHSLRAVLTTSAVAALGFLPMAISNGAGSEVQRPLATVVIFGIVIATVLTLIVLPALLQWMLKEEAGPAHPAE